MYPFSSPTKKLKFFTSAYDFIREFDIEGDYFEFGIHRARTFVMSLVESQRFQRKSMRHFAFDCFSGLPEDKTDTENPNFNQGRFATSEESFKNLKSPYVSNWEKVQTIPGYYDKSLNNELIRDLEQMNTKVALVNFDCDLPLSLKPALEFSSNFFVDGTIVYIDDWRNVSKGKEGQGLQEVWNDFVSEHNIQYSPFIPIGWWGISFIVNK